MQTNVLELLFNIGFRMLEVGSEVMCAVFLGLIYRRIGRLGK